MCFSRKTLFSSKNDPNCSHCTLRCRFSRSRFNLKHFFSLYCFSENNNKDDKKN